MGKYIKGNRSLVSYCWQRETELQKGQTKPYCVGLEYMECELVM